MLVYEAVVSRGRDAFYHVRGGTYVYVSEAKEFLARMNHYPTAYGALSASDLVILHCLRDAAIICYHVDSDVPNTTRRGRQVRRDHETARLH